MSTQGFLTSGHFHWISLACSVRTSLKEIPTAAMLTEGLEEGFRVSESYPQDHPHRSNPENGRFTKVVRLRRTHSDPSTTKKKITRIQPGRAGGALGKRDWKFHLGWRFCVVLGAFLAVRGQTLPIQSVEKCSGPRGFSAKVSRWGVGQALETLVAFHRACRITVWVARSGP